jgi:hypothetical protein
VNAEVFFHVLGAITLFGATASVAVLAFAARGRAAQQPVLATASFWTLLVVAAPAWVVLLALGTAAENTADYPNDPGWLGVGNGIADLGLLVLLASTFLAFRWRRAAADGWHVTALTWLMSVYLVLLAVAWWAMSAKVPS